MTAAVAVDVDESPLVSLSIDESEEGKQVAATAASIAAQDASTTVSKPPPPAKASVSKASVVTRKQTPQHALAQLYDYVQFTNTSALPRLYLMITVGSAYMAVTNAPRRSLLLDLLDMCKAVQHPTRGLFLRYYMQQMTRDQMPLEEKGGYVVFCEWEYMGACKHGCGLCIHYFDDLTHRYSRRGSLSDTLYFLLQNFTEMNKLWVRMQHQGPVRERPKREEERRDLRILVGTNLVRLSQLEGLDLRKYRGEVLPRILEQGRIFMNGPTIDDGVMLIITLGSRLV